MAPIAARVIEVLKDFHADELVLVDTQAADGFSTPPIPADSNHYFDWDRKNIDRYPACSIRPVSSTPLGVLQSGFGDRVNVLHRLAVVFHARISENPSGSEPRDVQKALQRYVVAGVRVLADLKNGLETIADPVRWGSPSVQTVVTWNAEATYGPEEGQEDGAVVCSATLPIDVQRVEAR